MKITDADVLWNPAGKRKASCRVIRHEQNGRDQPERMWMPASGLGPYGLRQKDPLRQLLGMFILFNTIVVRDGVPDNLVHRAFLEIDEYRNAISLDAPGRLACSDADLAWRMLSSLMQDLAHVPLDDVTCCDPFSRSWWRPGRRGGCGI